MAEREKKEDKSEERPPRDGVLRIAPPRGGAHEEPLVEATRAYARGDFGGVRRLARRVKAAACSEQEGAFADELLQRTRNDPVALIVALGCFALFWLVIYLTVWR